MNLHGLEGGGRPVWRWLLLTLLLGLGALELLLRLLYGGLLPDAPFYVSAPLSPGADPPQPGTYLPRPTSSWKLRNSLGQSYQLEFDALSLRTGAGRSPVARGHYLLVGDQQALGMGVPFEETFGARASTPEASVWNGGVPGYGVQDSLERAEALLAVLEPVGMVLLVNQQDDWEQVWNPAAERSVLSGGWRLSSSLSGLPWSLWARGPWSRLHLSYWLGQVLERLAASRDSARLVPPTWLVQPEALVADTQRMADRILAFAGAHPSLRLLVAYLPADLAACEARAWENRWWPELSRRHLEPWNRTVLKEQLEAALGSDLEWVDLSGPALEDPASWLEEGALSQRGHAAVGETLRLALEHWPASRLPASSESLEVDPSTAGADGSGAEGVRGEGD